MKSFTGEYASTFSFCLSFPRILCKVRRNDGSVLPNVVIETLLVGTLAAVAVYLNEYVLEKNGFAKEKLAITGHQVWGMMIAFLLVFRSQIAWGMYTEGRNHIGRVITATRDMGLEVVATLCAGQVSVKAQVQAAHARQANAEAAQTRATANDGYSQSRLRAPTTVCKSMKRNGSGEPSKPPQLAFPFKSDLQAGHAGVQAVHAGAAPAREGGPPGAPTTVTLSSPFRSDVRAEHVARSSLVDPPAEHVARSSLVEPSPGGEPSAATHKFSEDLREPSHKFSEDNLVLAFEVVRMLKLFYFCMVEHLRSSEGHAVWEKAHEETLKYATSSELDELLEECGEPQYGDKPEDVENTYHFKRYDGRDDVYITELHHPTRAKPLLVLSWVRMTLERGVNEGLLRSEQLRSFSAGMTELVSALGGVHKVDTMVLPFPYVQLLRWSLLVFCFSLPFFVASELSWATIPMCMVTTCTFYGLDEVGTELEQPFGVDPNDFKLIGMGKALAKDLDALLRTANKERVEGRHNVGKERQKQDRYIARPKSAATSRIESRENYRLEPLYNYTEQLEQQAQAPSASATAASAPPFNTTSPDAATSIRTSATNNGTI